jgi:hypothetical protein
MRSKMGTSQRGASCARKLRWRAVFGSAWLMLLATVAVAGEATMDERVLIYEVVVDGKPQSMLSFLPLSHVQSHGLAGPAIIGSLRKRTPDGGSLAPDNIAINRDFVALLHRVIAAHAPTDPAFANAAREQGEGWMYVIDRRTPTPGGDVPAEDIIASFKIANGAVVEGSYEPFASHRLVTERGMFRLDRFMQPKLMEALMALETEQP